MFAGSTPALHVKTKDNGMNHMETAILVIGVGSSAVNTAEMAHSLGDYYRCVIASQEDLPQLQAILERERAKQQFEEQFLELALMDLEEWDCPVPCRSKEQLNTPFQAPAGRSHKLANTKRGRYPSGFV